MYTGVAARGERERGQRARVGELDLRRTESGMSLRPNPLAKMIPPVTPAAADNSSYTHEATGNPQTPGKGREGKGKGRKGVP